MKEFVAEKINPIPALDITGIIHIHTLISLFIAPRRIVGEKNMRSQEFDMQEYFVMIFKILAI